MSFIGAALFWKKLWCLLFYHENIIFSLYMRLISNARKTDPALLLRKQRYRVHQIGRWSSTQFVFQIRCSRSLIKLKRRIWAIFFYHQPNAAHQAQSPKWDFYNECNWFLEYILIYLTVSMDNVTFGFILILLITMA